MGKDKRQKEQNCQIRKASEYLERKKNYKYLGILEADTIKQMKEKKFKKY